MTDQGQLTLSTSDATEVARLRGQVVLWWVEARRPQQVAELDELAVALGCETVAQAAAYLVGVEGAKVHGGRVSFGADAAAELCRYWAQTVPGRQNARPTPGRLTKLRARLADGYSAAQIRQAIDALATSDFHNGQNDRGQVYNDLTFLCRNGETLERFLVKAATQRARPTNGFRAALRGE